MSGERTIIKERILKGRGESHANLSLSSKLAQAWPFSAYALLTKKKAKKRKFLTKCGVSSGGFQIQVLFTPAILKQVTILIMKICYKVSKGDSFFLLLLNLLIGKDSSNLSSFPRQHSQHRHVFISFFFFVEAAAPAAGTFSHNSWEKQV